MGSDWQLTVDAPSVATHPVKTYRERVERGPMISPSPWESVQCTTGSTPAITAVTAPPSAVNSIGKGDAPANSSTGEAAFACAGTTTGARSATVAATKVPCPETTRPATLVTPPVCLLARLNPLSGADPSPDPARAPGAGTEGWPRSGPARTSSRGGPGGPPPPCPAARTRPARRRGPGHGARDRFPCA